MKTKIKKILKKILEFIKELPTGASYTLGR